MHAGTHTLETLAADEPAVGAWVLSASPRAAEAMAGTDLDWVGIDTEHAPVDPAGVEELVRAVEGDATPIVRLPSVEAAATGRAKAALDAGAGGVIVPGVDSAADAERAVRAARFPPEGERGVAGTTRANGYGVDFDGYVARANEETLVVVQIETPAAVERADEILSVPGVDVAFVGENDLSSAYGYPGEKDRPEVAEARETVLAAAADHDVHPGIGGRSPGDLADRIERGWRFFLLGADLSFVRRGIASFLSG